MPDSATFAGKYGDGLITVGGKQPNVYQQMMKNFEKTAREAGKDPSKMPRLIELNVEYTDNEQEAIENQKKYWAGTYIPALFDQKIYTPSMSQENDEAVGTDSLKKLVCISGNPDDHVKFIKQYVDLGLTHLIFHSALPDQRGFIQRFARDVMPRLREL